MSNGVERKVFSEEERVAELFATFLRVYSPQFAENNEFKFFMRVELLINGESKLLFYHKTTNFFSIYCKLSTEQILAIIKEKVKDIKKCDSLTSLIFEMSYVINENDKNNSDAVIKNALKLMQIPLDCQIYFIEELIKTMDESYLVITSDAKQKGVIFVPKTTVTVYTTASTNALVIINKTTTLLMVTKEMLENA